MKYISLIRRRTDLDRPAFRRYYEEVHAPLALRFFPPSLYQRNHLDEAELQPFDCLSEFAYPDDFDPFQVLAGEAGPQLAADEANFMDRECILTATATVLHTRAPQGSGVRRRELWLVPSPASRGRVVAGFEQLLTGLEPGLGVTLEWLEPCHCESFPFAALICVEGSFSGQVPEALTALGVLRLPVSSCPSPTENGSALS